MGSTNHWLDPPHHMIDCSPIGSVETPFESLAEAPRQGHLTDAVGVIELEPRYEPGLSGMSSGHTVDVVWFAHVADREVLQVDRDGPRGVFTTRSQDRPNPICVTRCTVLAVDGPRIRVEGVDMLDGSPVIDLKAPLDVGP